MIRSISFFISFIFTLNISNAQIQDSILFTGRFDFSDTTKAVFSHVSSSIKANFEGTGVSALLSAELGVSYCQVIIDGNDAIEDRVQIQISSKAITNFALASGLASGVHQIELVKTNQYDTKIGFHGFNITGGELKAKPERPAISIEFYGDSNPAGHSAWDPFDRGAVKDNGGYYTYPGITARMLNAEYINISMGGSGITDGAWWNLVDYHHLIHMDDPANGSNIWIFTDNHLNFTADAVVINLGANDYYSSSTKNDIKNGWKRFISDDLRTYYPNAHIVLANSYGWAYNEPADYVHEAIEELYSTGDTNVSYIKFPWLWGQEHAVVNEHAGFANILATHLAEKLGLAEPELSDLSSFVPKAEIYNGSFEISTIDEYADGWRPHGLGVSLIDSTLGAVEGENYLRIENTSWLNFANDASEGDVISVSVWIRKAGVGDNLGKLKLEFKDQAQNTISANEGLFGASDEWRQASTTAVAPSGTWSVWVVLVAESNSIIEFDKVEMSNSDQTDHIVAKCNLNHFKLYPNPCGGEQITVENSDQESGSISIIDISGRLVFKDRLNAMQNQKVIFQNRLNPGIYFWAIEHGNNRELKKLIVK